MVAEALNDFQPRRPDREDIADLFTKTKSGKSLKELCWMDSNVKELFIWKTDLNIEKIKTIDKPFLIRQLVIIRD